MATHCFKFFVLTVSASLILAFCLPATVVSADEITLKNGDRISGTVLDTKDGKLGIQTPYAGKIEIRLDQIAAIETDASVTLRLQDKKAHTGRLVTSAGQMILLADDAYEKTLFTLDQLHSINIPDVVWSGQIHLGGSHLAGNSDRQGITFGADTVRRGIDNRLNLSFLYSYAEEDDRLTTRNAYAAAKYDHFFGPAFYGLLSVELLNDKFKDLHLRAVIGPGGGYQLWEQPGRSLAFEAGIAYFMEDRIGDRDQQWFTARLAAVYSHRLSTRIRFTNTLVLYPQLEDAGEYSLRNDAALITSLGADWSLRLGNLWERDSKPVPGVKKDDFRTSVALQYSF